MTVKTIFAKYALSGNNSYQTFAVKGSHTPDAVLSSIRNTIGKRYHVTLFATSIIGQSIDITITRGIK